jgi:hypothetical protein
MRQTLRRVYLESIPVAAALLPRRWKADMAVVDRILAALHDLYLEPVPGPSGAEESPSPTEPALAEFDFGSKVPLLGPAIAGFRSLWYSVAARWAVRYLAKQQEAINRQYQTRLEEQETMHRHAVRSLVALSQEVARVIQQLEAEQNDDA